jgi:hypothetical protein
MTGKPFQSKLTPHFALITEMRRKRQSWQEIVNHLKTLGITSDKGSVCAFFKRHRRRPAPMGMELEKAPERRFALIKPKLELPELTEIPPPPSEGDPDPLTLPPITKKPKWNQI